MARIYLSLVSVSRKKILNHKINVQRKKTNVQRLGPQQYILCNNNSHHHLQKSIVHSHLSNRDYRHELNLSNLIDILHRTYFSVLFKMYSLFF